MLVHLEELLQLLVDGLHDVIGHFFTLEILQELLYLLLLLIGLLIEVALERLEDFLVLLLCLGLITAKFVLLFHL